MSSGQPVTAPPTKELKFSRTLTSQFLAALLAAIFLGSGASYLTIRMNEERLQSVSAQLISTTEATRELSELMVVLNERIQTLKKDQDQVGERLTKVSDKLNVYMMGNMGNGKELLVAIETLKLRMSHVERRQ